MSVLDNAIDAIEAGFEDFTEGSQRRLKSAVRNVHAGLLLIFKHKLIELSPPGSDDLLIREKLVPILSSSGQVEFRGTGNKTVDVQSIKERFKSLGVTVDWKDFDEINRIRNELEHHYTKATIQQIKEVLAKAFSVATKFVAKNFANLDLREKLSRSTWEGLLEIKTVYDAELEKCKQSWREFDHVSEYVLDHVESFSCPNCCSDLMLFTKACDEPHACCRSCGETLGNEKIAIAIVAEPGGSSAYSAIKDGGTQEITDCPECGEFAFIMSEGYCVSCECELSTECKRCGADIIAEEMSDTGYCGWCDHMREKMMNED